MRTGAAIGLARLGDQPLTLGDDRYALHAMHPEIAVKQLMGDKWATTVK